MNEFFAVAFATLQLLGATPIEVQQLKSRLTPESRWTPTAVNGSCCGPWQTNYHIVSRLLGKTITCKDLQTKPEVAAEAALASLRANKRVCGKNWLCGWKYGPYSDTCKDKCKQPRGKAKVKPKRSKP